MNQQHLYSNTAVSFKWLVIRTSHFKKSFSLLLTIINSVTTHVKMTRKMKVKPVFLGFFLHFLLVLEVHEVLHIGIYYIATELPYERMCNFNIFIIRKEWKNKHKIEKIQAKYKGK